MKAPGSGDDGVHAVRRKKRKETCAFIEKRAAPNGEKRKSFLRLKRGGDPHL